MATTKSIPEASGQRTIQDDRLAAGRQACWEIEALCEVGRELAEKVGAVDDGDQDTLMRHALQLRGVLRRIEDLSIATLAVLDGCDDTQHIRQRVLGFSTAVAA